MLKILSKDQEMKENLAEIYGLIHELVSRDSIGDGLQKVLLEIYGKLEDKLTSYKDQLMNEECPIVVTGNIHSLF